MTKTIILKRLLFCLVISMILTVLFWAIYTPLMGCFPMTNSEKTKMALLNIGICILTFISSLTALYLNRNSVSSSRTKTFLAFMGFPLLLFLLSVFIFVFGKGSDSPILDFFILGLPPSSFCMVLFYYYFKFRHQKGVKP
jgi:Na+-driven multidrug efflux pump